MFQTTNQYCIPQNVWVLQETTKYIQMACIGCPDNGEESFGGIVLQCFTICVLLLLGFWGNIVINPTGIWTKIKENTSRASWKPLVQEHAVIADLLAMIWWTVSGLAPKHIRRRWPCLAPGMAVHPELWPWRDSTGPGFFWHQQHRSCSCGQALSFFLKIFWTSIHQS